VIKPGQTIVVRNEGMPTFKRPDEVRSHVRLPSQIAQMSQRGNLYVVLDVEFPEDGWLATADHTVCRRELVGAICHA
jgi:DnaJ family protein A protein 2